MAKDCNTFANIICVFIHNNKKLQTKLKKRTQLVNLHLKQRGVDTGYRRRNNKSSRKALFNAYEFRLMIHYDTAHVKFQVLGRKCRIGEFREHRFSHVAVGPLPSQGCKINIFSLSNLTHLALRARKVTKSKKKQHIRVRFNPVNLFRRDFKFYRQELLESFFFRLYPSTNKSRWRPSKNP